MRRFMMMFLMILVALSIPINVFAQETGKYQTAGDLVEEWTEEEDVPDYITGFWSTDGSQDNITFGLVPTEEGPEGMMEVLSLVIDDSTVTFVVQTYSRNHLYGIMEDLNTYFDKELGFLTAGADDVDNCVNIEIHTDYQENPATLAAVAELEARYGNAIIFSYTDKVPVVVPGTTETPAAVIISPTNPASPLPLLLCGCVVMFCFLAFCTIQRRRLLLLHQANVVSNETVDIRMVETQIAASAPQVPETLDARIQASVNAVSKQNF